MPCTRARSSHTRQRTSSYDEPSAARRPRRGRAHSSAPRGRRAPSLQSTLFIAAPQGHSGRNHSVWGTRAATRHRKRHPPSCVVDPPRASFRPAPLPTDLRPRILYRPPPRAGSYNLRSGSCTYLTPAESALPARHVALREWQPPCQIPALGSWVIQGGSELAATTQCAWKGQCGRKAEAAVVTM